MQEILGGQRGGMTVATQSLLQGWNCRLPGKYKDMLLSIGTEELAHVEMIITMIDRLLDHAPLKPDAADRSKEAAAGYGQHNPQQDRKSTRLNSSHANISYAVFCLKK